ncbi:MAG: TolC family protein [Bdellovibrionota bacterium]
MVPLILTTMLFMLSQDVFAKAAHLKDVIGAAFSKNPEIQSLQKKVQAKIEYSKGQSALSDPMIGVSQLERGNVTRYWTIAQRIDFPFKYNLREKIQRSKADEVKQLLEEVRLALRAEVITTYYGIYAIQKIKELTRNDLEKIKEFSRIAETKYAAGSAPMQDSMKAHFIQTQVEADLIALNQEEDGLQARMGELVGQLSPTDFMLAKLDLPVPNLSLSAIKLNADSSPLIKQKQVELESAQLETRLSRLGYAPDFQLRYQGYLSGDPKSSQIITLEMSVPLWFWGKTANEKAAVWQQASKEFELSNAVQSVEARISSLKSKVRNQFELLNIFKTSLIPQAVTSYESSIDAYKASKINFLELLDSERSLLKVQIAYFRTLTQYIASVTQLELSLGQAISGLGT